MLLDNGDFLQGNPMGDYIAYERGMKEGDVHPVIAAMNALGFDASTLGNHEFNYGLDFLMKSLAGAQFPVVSANVALEHGRQTRPRTDDAAAALRDPRPRRWSTAPATAHPIRIGVIGFVPPQIMIWDRRHLEGKRRDARHRRGGRGLGAARCSEEGADIVVALSHSGIDAPAPADGMENASVPLAAGAGDRRDRDRPPATWCSRRPTYEGIAGVDAAGRPDRRQAGDDGRLLGLASRRRST